MASSEARLAFGVAFVKDAANVNTSIAAVAEALNLNRRSLNNHRSGATLTIARGRRPYLDKAGIDTLNSVIETRGDTLMPVLEAQLPVVRRNTIKRLIARELAVVACARSV